jgi:hypothetical protein
VRTVKKTVASVLKDAVMESALKKTKTVLLVLLIADSVRHQKTVGTECAVLPREKTVGLARQTVGSARQDVETIFVTWEKQVTLVEKTVTKNTWNSMVEY